MARVAAYIRIEGGQLPAVSLAPLAHGRRIANQAGATLHAVAFGGSSAQSSALAATAAGADRVSVISIDEDAILIGSKLHEAVESAASQLQATLHLFPNTGLGRALGSRLAAKLEAPFFVDPEFRVADDGTVYAQSLCFGHSHQQDYFLGENSALVATSAAGRGFTSVGEATNQSTVIADAPIEGGFAIVDTAADPGAALDAAEVVVSAGGGADARDVELVKDLATALGGEFAVTDELCRRGLGSRDREVGAGGRRISPRLYVSCAASGSHKHLCAVAPGTVIVAINRDSRAAIFRAAHHAMVGSIAELVPGLISAVSQGAEVTA